MLWAIQSSPPHVVPASNVYIQPQVPQVETSVNKHNYLRLAFVLRHRTVMTSRRPADTAQSRLSRVLSLCRRASSSKPPAGNLRTVDVEEGLSTSTKIYVEHVPDLIPLEDGDKVQNTHSFSDRANWLVPDRILLGKYPGENSSDPPSAKEAARERVRDVVSRGGVTDLLCLQQEVPPHTGDDKRWTVVADGSRYCDAGFRCYKADAITASREGMRPRQQSKGSEPAKSPAAGDESNTTTAQVAFHHYPIPDLTPADSVEALSALVNDLAALMLTGKVLYIHCWAGRGRTGLVAACLLGLLYPELNAEQALTRVDAYYRTRSAPVRSSDGGVASFAVNSDAASFHGGRYRLSPDTLEQEVQVRLFYKQILHR